MLIRCFFYTIMIDMGRGDDNSAPAGGISLRQIRRLEEEAEKDSQEEFEQKRRAQASREGGQEGERSQNKRGPSEADVQEMISDLEEELTDNEQKMRARLIEEAGNIEYELTDSDLSTLLKKDGEINIPLENDEFIRVRLRDLQTKDGQPFTADLFGRGETAYLGGIKLKAVDRRLDKTVSQLRSRGLTEAQAEHVSKTLLQVSQDIQAENQTKDSKEALAAALIKSAENDIEQMIYQSKLDKDNKVLSAFPSGSESASKNHDVVERIQLVNPDFDDKALAQLIDDPSLSYETYLEDLQDSIADEIDINRLFDSGLDADNPGPFIEELVANKGYYTYIDPIKSQSSTQEEVAWREKVSIYSYSDYLYDKIREMNFALSSEKKDSEAIAKRALGL